MPTNTTEARERAKRALDGMSYHRDTMAREVVSLADECDRWRAAWAALPAERKKEPGFGGFGKAFDEAWKR